MPEESRSRPPATERRECVVVGAGLLGLFAAFELARRGRDVLCVEQARVGHPWSGSKGRARIFRLGYGDPLYVSMAVRALAAWHQLEEEWGAIVIRPTGCLSFGDGVAEILAAMVEAGVRPVTLAGHDLHERFPGVAVSGEALFEEDAGVLEADQVLRSLRSRIPELREGEQVTRVADSGRSVVLRTNRGVLECSVAVLCCGAWSGDLWADAGVRRARSLSPSLQPVAYYRPTADCGLLPAFVERAQVTTYGLQEPAGDDGSVGLYKVGIHDEGPAVTPGDGEMVATPREREWLGGVVDRLLPGVDPTPEHSERCCYDNSPDGDFVLDRVGRVVIGGGTSGHGFKFGPLLGRALADLAEGRAPGGISNRERFSIGRRAFDEGSATGPGATRPAL